MGYEIKLDKILETARIGVYRSWVFMGLGVNCSSSESIHFEVAGASHIKIYKNEISIEDLQKIKEEFKIWIVGKGLEELIETFAVFLEQLFSMLLFVEAWKIKGRADQDKQTRFNQLGLKDKLTRLENYNIRTTFKDDVLSVNQARHCLTHRLGIVDERDVNSTDGLTVQWRTPQLYGHNEDGTEFIPNMEMFEENNISKSPVEFPEGSPVKMRNDLRSKVFSVGSRIILEPRDLKEICFWFLVLVNELETSIIECIKSSGVTVSQAEKNASQ